MEINMDNQGWIKIHRQLLDNEIWEYERFSRAQAWIDLLLLANREEKKFSLRGVDIIAERGQVVRSVVGLAKRWQWNKRTANRFLSWLESRGMIHCKSDNVCTYISINNYDTYQYNTPQDAQQSAQQSAQRLHSRVHTNKNEENDKKENKYPLPISITEIDLEEIAAHYQVPLSFVRSKYEDMVIWADSKPNNPKLRGRNWRLTLMRFVKDDAIKIKQGGQYADKKRGIDATGI